MRWYRIREPERLVGGDQVRDGDEFVRRDQVENLPFSSNTWKRR